MTLPRPTRFLTLLLAGLALATPLRAEEVPEMIDRARELYRQGDLRRSAEELGFALAAIARQRQEHYARLFPAAPQGWTLEDSQDDAGGNVAAQLMGGGIGITREYTQADGEKRITARMMIDSPVAQGMASIVSNPTIMPPHTRRVRIGADNAMLRQEPGDNTMELTLVRGNTMVQLTSEGVDKAETLVELMKAFDFNRLQSR
ncbi:hypothetical protein [Pseudoroseomonas cervicalis]|uniref:hypothetical protein n=1 Tax=Teichococcus cervicalis TaxID=204525 RepID=UPI0027817EDE|nr:hypothetical protein [Pseudoroseomonas cervicalis]MDQ1081331.1 hypothetical protein [Pseudoroseomonas cervicalis]